MLAIVSTMLHRPFHMLLLALTVLMVSAQMACAADDLTVGAGEGHSVHHAELIMTTMRSTRRARTPV